MSYTGGPLNGLSITNAFDALLRRTADALDAQASTLVTYGYDAASRLKTVSNGNNTAGYAYLANSPLVSNISFTNNGSLRLTTTKSYDNLNRLTSISSATNAVAVASSAYEYNSANQRTTVTNTDSSRWVYQYDKLGQVTSGIKYWSDASVVAGQQFGYAFDDIGNRTTTTAGGSEFGANVRWANYSVNNLNQYTSRTVPNAIDVVGDATNTATVTVNNQGTYRKGTYYRKELAIDNSASPAYQSVTNLAVLQNGTNSDIITNAIGNVYLPKTPEQFTYDLDGNLTSDGRWTNVWDGENRLISMQAISSVPSGAKQKLDFSYDYHGRRAQKIVSTWNGSTYIPQSTNKFIYDAWNLVAEVNGPNNALIRSYMWGSDISGSRQGAGGVGGLLAISSPISAQFTCFDGNGNITALIDSTNSAISAQYEYGSFGEPIRAMGPLAKMNPFRFSTQYQDDETDLICYLHRYYIPLNGRWLNRDSIGERGGVNLYGFIENDSINDVDYLGNLSVKDIVLSKLNGGVGIARTFPVGAIGPVPIFATVGVQGKVFKCRKNGQMQCWGEVKGFVELYGRIGAGYDDRERFPQPKGRDRNQRIPDPYNPGGTAKLKDLEGKLLDPTGKFRDRQGFIELVTSKSCDCPKEGFSGSLKIFVRGSAGVGFIGAQFNAEKTLLSSEDIEGVQFTAGVAFGVTGAVVEAGGAGELQYTGPLSSACGN